jgi:large subunit ribosomal protein L17
MRHRVVRNKLASDVEHMKSLINSLSTDLIMNEKIETTLAKAKALRPYIEKLVSFAGKAMKSGDKIQKFNAVKSLNTKIHTNEATKKLLEDIAGRFADVSGGYTRIVKTGNRVGDRAAMARIEFTKSAEKKAPKKAAAKRATKKVEAVEEKVETTNE